MDAEPLPPLAPVFQAVLDEMETNRQAFNQADELNGNHGDHMVEIFSVAVQAAQEKQRDGLAEAMDYAGELLRRLEDNATAQVYACGLEQLGEKFHKYSISLTDLEPYLRKVIHEGQEEAPGEPVRSKEVLKALVAALAGWQQSEAGAGQAGGSLDLGTMFDMGIAYMQAKGRNPTRAEVIADAAATVSPLGKNPLRYQSGKCAIHALLLAIAKN